MSGPLVVNRSDDKGYPFLFRQSKWFAQSDRAWFRDRHDKRVPYRIFPSGSKVAGFGVSAAFSWRNRHDKQVLIGISPKHPRIASFGAIPAFSCGIAMIDRFPFDFPQTQSPGLA